VVSDDFEKTDAEAGVSIAAEVVPTAPDAGALIPGGTSEYREQLVRKYHGGAMSLVERLRQEGMSDNESMLVALVNEMVKETDNLLGNHLIATENGALRDASVISYKRSEVLEKAIKAVQSKQSLDRERGIDLDSPAMAVIFKYFFGKVRDVFEHIELPEEQRDIFFKTLGDETDNWKKELREALEVASPR